MLILIVEIRQKGTDKKSEIELVLITHKSIPILKNGCHAYVAWTEGGK